MPDIATLIKNRRRLADMITKLNQKSKDSVSGMKDNLEKIDSAIMKYLNEQGLDSVKSEFGTAFKDTKDRLNISDSIAFKRHIISQLLLSIQRNKYVNSDGEWKPSLDGIPSGDVLLNGDCEVAINSGALDLLTLQANKNACKDFMRENDGRMPNGVNYTTFTDIKVRK